ncbi:hypothetical protein EJB05_32231, partial [Eragrostis curvula]
MARSAAAPARSRATSSDGSWPPWRGGARDVEVDLTPTHGNRAQLDAEQDGKASMELTGDVFLTENSLARLSLYRFSLRAVPPGLAGLRSLSLSRADITDETVQAVLSTCRSLEFLTLSRCHQLTSVRIAGDNLRSMELVRCLGVRELRVAAPALESLAFHGNILCLDDSEDDDERVAAVDLGAAPALRDAYLSHLGFGTEDDVHDKDTDLSARRLAKTDNAYATLSPAYVGTRWLPRELDRAVVESGTAAALTSVVDDSCILIHGDDFVLGHLKLIKVANFRGTRLEFVLLSFLIKRAPALEQLVLITVDEDEAPGDEQLKIIQQRVSAMRKASPEAQVIVCRPSEVRNHNPAHTRFYHEEA